MARLATGIWVAAYRRRLETEGIGCFILAKGDETSGTVVVKHCRMDGTATAWQRGYDPMTGERAWMVYSEGEERQVDEALSRARGRDPDIWIVEVEDARGRALLDDPSFN